MKRAFPLIVGLLVSVISVFAQTANVTKGCFPLDVKFTAASGMSTYFWDFKDGTTSQLANPSKTFTKEGKFVVSLHASAGSAAVGTVAIDVYKQPVPKFTTDTTKGCAPLQVKFTDNTDVPQGYTITGYKWVFTGGGSAEGSPAKYSFGKGDYDVSLQLVTSDPSCNATKLYKDVISVSNQPKVSITTAPAPAKSCTAPFTVKFTGNATVDNGTPTYEWDFGNGQTSTSKSPSNQIYSQKGNFNAKLTVKDGNGCSGTRNVPVIIGTPQASFSIPDTVCINEPVTLVNNSPSGPYSWTFGSDATPSTSSQVTPTVTFSKSGYYNVKLALGGDCPDDTTITVFVEEVKAEFTSSLPYSCSWPMAVDYTPVYVGATEYEWKYYNGNTSSGFNGGYTYVKEDTNDYSVNGPNEINYYFETVLTVTSSAGCTDTYVHVDTMHLPNARIFPDVVDGCVPLTVTFNDSSISNEPITNWDFYFGDGNKFNGTTDASQTHTYTKTGEYNAYLIITNDKGCKDTSYFNPIKVGDKLQPDFSVSETEICIGEQASLSAIAFPLEDSVDTWHFSGDGDRVFHCTDNSSVNWTFNDETGPQDISLTVGFNGCYSTNKKQGVLNVKGPIARFSFSGTCDKPYDIAFQNESKDASELSWNFADGNNSTVNNPTHKYSAQGDFSVTLTARNPGTGCPDQVATRTVKIREVKADAKVDSLICREIPVTFDGSATQGVDGNCGKGYTWHFSDPTMRPVTTQNASENFSFANSGSHTIILVVEDIHGCTDTDTVKTRVFGVDASFTMSDNLICLPNEVKYKNTTISDTTTASWSWSFGDGAGSKDSSTSHVYTAGTTFIATLTAKDTLGCQDVVSKTINTYIPTNDIVVTADTNACLGEKLTFTAANTSGFSFDWDFGNDSTSDRVSRELAYDSTATYDVRLIFTENISGCVDSTFTKVIVKAVHSVNFTTDYDMFDYLCPNTSVTFTDSSVVTPGSVNYSWDLDDGNTSTLQNPAKTFTSNGVYNISLTVTIPQPFGCTKTHSKSYNVKGPKGNFEMNPATTICRLDPVTFTLKDTADVEFYQWDFGDGNVDSLKSPITHAYTYVPPGGTTNVTLVLSNKDGSCPKSAVKQVKIHQVVADFMRNGNDLDTAICFGKYPLANNSKNVDSWYWDFGNGQTSTSENPGALTFDSAGTYQVTLGVGNTQLTCTNTIVKTIILHPRPEIEAVGDTICEGAEINLSVLNPESDWDFEWTHPELAIKDSLTANASSQPDKSTSYQIWVSNKFDCEDSISIPVIVIEEVTIPDWDTTIVMADDAQIPLIHLVDSLYHVVWTPTDDLSCDSCVAPIAVQVMDTIVYTLDIEDINQCKKQTALFTINVFPQTFIEMPTTFTPNGDGINDIIYVRGWGVKELLAFKIFNRWGEMVFESTDMNVGWDGYYKGMLQNNDVYVYKVKAMTWTNETKALEGHINLLR